VPRRGALVLFDDGTVVGDPIVKTTLEALDWVLRSRRVLSVDPYLELWREGCSDCRGPSGRAGLE